MSRLGEEYEPYSYQNTNKLKLLKGLCEMLGVLV